MAIISIVRLAGEGKDRKLEPGDYYLSPEEHALMAGVKQHFEKVVVLLNVCGQMDMEWVDVYQPSAVLMVWIPGQEGASAAADILMGHVNPSGRLTDTIAQNWRDLPSSENFGAWADGFELYTGDEDQIPYWGGVGNHEMVPVGETVVRPLGNRRYTEYQEGLYIGYRYFSTFGVPVRYPFGYGLSYTSFSREISGFAKTADGITFAVSVTNTGSVPGKEVIQIYFHGAESALERPDRELVAFQKTKLLAPGERETLVFSIPNRDLACYSEEKAAWLLQKGENTLYIGGDSLHNEEFAVFETQETILEQVSNQATPVHHTRLLRQLSKRDPEGTRPVAPPISANSGEKHGSMKRDSYTWPAVIGTEAQWKLADVKAGRVTMEEFLKQADDFELVVLLVGANVTGFSAVETQNKDIEQGIPMDMMTRESQLGPLSEWIPGMGGYTTTIERLGIPTITMCDGPAGIGAGKPHKLAFPTATITACTFNTELAERLGDALGAEAEERKVDVWLAPAFNIHRNPLAGRNYEYYAEDPLLSG
ncbi:MAG: glycoside hydrolase family 3 C-terminal domain-containing protein, partial [Dysosmobacter welbionis]